MLSSPGDRIAPGTSETPVTALPDELIAFVVPSRLCLPDELGHKAWQRFGDLAPGWERVQAIVDARDGRDRRRAALRRMARPGRHSDDQPRRTADERNAHARARRLPLLCDTTGHWSEGMCRDALAERPPRGLGGLPVGPPPGSSLRRGRTAATAEPRDRRTMNRSQSGCRVSADQRARFIASARWVVPYFLA